MKRILVLLFVLFVTGGVWGQYSLTVTTYSQNFDGLGTGNSTVAGGDLNLVSGTLNGWYFFESGTNANTTITAGTGSASTGDTYNFGAAAGADRTLGGLQSGSLNPTFGFYFTNNTGGTITDIAITYNGETWRVGTAGRSDRIDFQYSTDATSLSTGTWTDADPLDYANPGQATGSGSVQHTASISNTLSGLSIANTATFFIRWTDFNASGSDDGMGVNDFSFTATLAPVNTITTGTVSSPPFILANCSATATGTVAFTSTDVFTAGNTFTAQLSDDIGSFSSPANIGSLALSGTNPSGTINITIPAGTVGGTGYKIRVVSDNPSVIGSSSSAFTITQQGVGGCASSHTDYYRSFQTGNWGTLSTWESSPDNSNWIAATLVPTYLANTITVQNTHTVTVVANASADQLVIANGATLQHTAGTFTIEDGTGPDMNIQSGGVLLLPTIATSPSFGVGSPSIQVSSGGTVRVSNTGLTGAGTGVNANNYDYQNASILEYTVTSPFSTSSVTYFPNAAAGVIPIFRTLNGAAISVGAGIGNNTTINGVFECNGSDVNWQNGGTKTFRNGIRGSGNVVALASSGKFIINGTTAELGGAGTLVLPTTGLEIGTSTLVTMISNKTATGDISLLADSYVDLGTYNLTVTGTVSGGASNSFIKTSGTGYLKLNTVATKTFPIGNTSYNPIIITNGGGVNDYYARVATGINNPAVAFPTYGINRTWYIAASAVTPGVTVTYQYAAADMGAGILPTDQVEILQSDYTAWSIIAGNTGISQAGTNPYTVTTATALTINNSATPYAIGKNGGWILPIDCIISTRAQKRNNTGIISWTVNSCAGVNSFEVQRSVSNSGFRTIGMVSPVINQTDFSFTDASLAGGTNLYRIKVNRSSGSVKYSNTVVLLHNSNDLLITTIAPNPVHHSAMLTVSTANPSVVDFKVFDMSGKIMKQWTARIAEGNNTIEMNVEELPAGSYSLFASAGQAKTVFRFVKQ